MSVRTAADEHVDEARKAVSAAMYALAEVVANECWRHDHYTAEFDKCLRDACVLLLDARRLLGGKTACQDRPSARRSTGWSS